MIASWFTSTNLHRLGKVKDWHEECLVLPAKGYELVLIGNIIRWSRTPISMKWADQIRMTKASGCLAPNPLQDIEQTNYDHVSLVAFTSMHRPESCYS
jgi:hypothetical protein